MNAAPLIDAIPNFHMWVTFIVIIFSIILLALDRIPLELSAIGIVVILLSLFYFFPYTDTSGKALLSSEDILKGFANPVIFTILSLLVIGQGLFHTGAVERPAQWIDRLGQSGALIAFAISLLAAGLISAFLNNTPVVVIFIPIMAAVAARIGLSQSHVLMPLSFICILGGMTTLIGSSANLIAAALAFESGGPKIGFFDFFVPGSLLAGIGAFYVIVILPRIITPRATMAQSLKDASGKQFIAQITLTSEHPWIGIESAAGLFPRLKNMTVRLVQRGPRAILPPFEEITLQEGDVVIVAATRKVLTEALKDRHSVLTLENIEGEASDQELSATEDAGKRQNPNQGLTMAEAVIAPGSRLIGSSIEQASLNNETRCIVLGIQRRSRMLRTSLNEIRLEAGDVLLMLGTRNAVRSLRTHRDLLLLEWSASELPITHHANRALLIFGTLIVAASSGMVPITIAALGGAIAMITFGCLNIRQASRAVDRKIFLLIGAAFAMAEAMRVTGGAAFLAHSVVDNFAHFGPSVLLSAIFLMTAILTNFLSNHATAALLAPVVVSAANEIGTDPAPFVYCLIFALNCSFATPIAYQTNMIVMGPGHYRFSDFLKGGLPLILILWVAYSLFAPFYYGLN